MHHDEDYQRFYSMASNIGLMCAHNQAIVLAAMFYQLALASPPDWMARYRWIAEQIRTTSADIPTARLEPPITRSEALALGSPLRNLRVKTVVTMACVFYEIERELGTNHVAFQPGSKRAVARGITL